MAKLPQAVNVVGGVSPQQMPGVQAPADAFGADMGKAVSQLGAFIEDEAQKQQRLDNQAEAQELSNELNTRLRNLELGDGDQEVGYKNRLGRNAMDQRQTYEEQAEKIRKELVARATNPIVRQNFSGVAANRTGQFLTSVGGHFNAQRKAYRKTSLDNTTNVATDDAVNATDDETRLARANDAYTATFNYYSDDQGYKDAIAKTFAEEARSKVHTAVINSIVDNQPGVARAYYEKVKSQIDSGDRPAMERALRGGYVKEQSAALAAHPKASEGTINERVAWAKTQSTTDIEVQDALIQRIQADFRLEETARKLKIRGLREAAFNMIETGKQKDGSPISITDISDLPAELLATLPGNDMNAIQTYIKNKARRGSGFALTSDFTTTSKIDELLIGEDDQKLVDYDLNAQRTKLSQSDFRRYRNLQIAAKRRIDNDEAKDPNYTLANKTLKLAFDAAGIKTTAAASKTQKRLRTVVTENVYALVEQAKSEGRKATREEINRQIAADLLRVDPPGTFNEGPRATRDLGEGYAIPDLDDTEVQQQVATATGVPLPVIQKIISDHTKAKTRAARERRKAPRELMLQDFIDLHNEMR